jgi:RNA recognition motif-containing protein
MEGYCVPLTIKNTFISISPSSTPTFSRSKTCSVLDSISEHSSDMPSPLSPLSVISDQSMFQDDRTTLMIRNIPNKYKRNWLVQEIGEGCDFVYLPMSRKKTHMNLGYAFVNFKSVELAQQFLQDFQGYQWQRIGKKNATVCYAEIQGFEANVAYFQEKREVDTTRKFWIAGN